MFDVGRTGEEIWELVGENGEAEEEAFQGEKGEEGEDRDGEEGESRERREKGEGSFKEKVRFPDCRDNGKGGGFGCGCVWGAYHLCNSHVLGKHILALSVRSICRYRPKAPKIFQADGSK